MHALIALHYKPYIIAGIMHTRRQPQVTLKFTREINTGHTNISLGPGISAWQSSIVAVWPQRQLKSMYL